MRREWRLRQRDDFARVRRSGRTMAQPWFVLGYVPNGLAHNRYGLIISKRLGKAVQRNRMRRRLREALRLLHPGLQQGHDLVFIVRQPLLQQPFSALEHALKRLCEQAGLSVKGGSQ